MGRKKGGFFNKIFRKAAAPVAAIGATLLTGGNPFAGAAAYGTVRGVQKKSALAGLRAAPTGFGSGSLTGALKTGGTKAIGSKSLLSSLGTRGTTSGVSGGGGGGGFLQGALQRIKGSPIIRNYLSGQINRGLGVGGEGGSPFNLGFEGLTGAGLLSASMGVKIPDVPPYGEASPEAFRTLTERILGRAFNPNAIFSRARDLLGPRGAESQATLDQIMADIRNPQVISPAQTDAEYQSAVRKLDVAESDEQQRLLDRYAGFGISPSGSSEYREDFKDVAERYGNIKKDLSAELAVRNAQLAKQLQTQRISQAQVQFQQEVANYQHMIQLALQDEELTTNELLRLIEGPEARRLAGYQAELAQALALQENLGTAGGNLLLAEALGRQKGPYDDLFAQLYA